MKRFRVLATLCALVLTACGDGGTQSPDFTPVVTGLTVTPLTASVAATETVQFSATATVTTPPGSPTTETVELNTTATWTTSDPAIATINGQGLATGVAPGTVTVTAEKDGKTAVATLTVGIAPLNELRIEPATATIEIAATLQFRALGKFVVPPDQTAPDVEVPAVWSSSDAQIATIDPATGLARGVNVGTVTITAVAGGQTATATLTVTGQLVELVVTPETATIALGQTRLLFTASGLCRNGSAPDAPIVVCAVDNVVWASSNANASVLATSGTVTGLQIGTATITATKGAFSDTGLVTVTPPVLEQVVIVREPVTAPITPLTADTAPINTTKRYRALGVYSNDPTPRNIDLPDSSITWASSNTLAATTSSPGRVTLVTVPPTAQATAQSIISVLVEGGDTGVTTDDFTASLTLTITDQIVLLAVEDIVFNPAATVPVGQTATAIARGRYNNGALLELPSAQIDFSSSDPAIATVATAVNGTTTVTANPTTPGVTTITAALKDGVEPNVLGDDRSASAPFTVTDAVCRSPLLASGGATITNGGVGGLLGPLSCVLGLTCSYASQDAVIDSDRDSFGQINITLGLEAVLSFTVQSPVMFPGGDRVGFVIANPAGDLLSALALGQQITIQTLLGGVPVQSTGVTDVLQLDLLGTRLIGGFPVQQGLVSFPTTAGSAYDGLRVSFSGGLLAALSQLQVYSACAVTVPPAP